MSRRLTIILSVLAVAVFGVVYLWPDRAGADPDVSVSGRVHLGDGAVRLDARIGDRDRLRDRGDGRRDRHWRRWDRPVVVLQAPAERVIERQTVIIQQPPPAPAPVAEPEPPAPLDPRGRARTVGAAGQPGPREWVLGNIVPADLPHVVLNPVAYGLPRPPQGQIYARFGSDVLRIDSTSRRILGVLGR